MPLNIVDNDTPTGLQMEFTGFLCIVGRAAGFFRGDLKISTNPAPFLVTWVGLVNPHGDKSDVEIRPS